jgi:hypothetical protein
MGKKLGRKLLVFVGVVTIGQVLLFNHYNSLFSSSKMESSPQPQQVQQQEVKMAALAQHEVTRLQKLQYHFITVSPDQAYVTYLDSQNVLHMENVQTKQEVTPAKNQYTVQYISWIQDPESSTTKVFVGEEIAPGDLELKTVDVGDGTQNAIAHFTGLAADAKFQKITFSFDTNDIYILVNNSSTSAVYHIGTMKHVTQVPVGGRYIKNIALSSDGTRLYFEDRLNGAYNVLYFDNQYVSHRVQLNAALVGVVGNDVYYGDIDQNGLVTTVYKMNTNGQSTVVSTLPSPTLAANINITASGQIQTESSTT